MLIKNRGDEDHTIYMKSWIGSESNKIIKWTFRVNKNLGSMFAGLASRDLALERDFVDEAESPNYCISYFGSVWKPGISHHVRNDATAFDYAVQTGVIVTYTLDLTKQTFSSEIADRRQVISFKSIETGKSIRYKFAMKVTQKESSVTLVDYKVSS